MNKPQKDRVHASNQRASGPKLTSYLWLAVFLWFVLLICGFSWIFFSSDNAARRKEVQNKVDNKLSFRKVLDNPSIVDTNIAITVSKPESQSKPIIVDSVKPAVSDKIEQINVNSISKPIVVSSLKAPVIEPNLKKVENKNVTPAVQKKRKYTFKEIWAMPAIEQRAALHSMHTLIPPSEKMANDFIAEAKSAFLNDIQPGKTPIWPIPGDGVGAPGTYILHTY